MSSYIQMVDNRSWLDKFKFKLYPTKYCPDPDIKTSEDVLVCRSVVELSAIDRIRVLFSGKVTVITKTATENRIIFIRTTSVSYPSL